MENLSCPINIVLIYTVAILVIKGVFLVVQCGKSAAIYACAQEQGFEVLEVLPEIAYFCCFNSIDNSS